MSVRPTLLIVGAGKSGTTSLHEYLSRHPDIFMSWIKEPCLLLDDTDTVIPFWTEEESARNDRTRRYFRGGLGNWHLWLQSLRGYSGERVIGESSTYYTYAPYLGQEVPQRLAELPHAPKLIYIMRNPYERILSHYYFDLKLGVTTTDMEAALERKGLYLALSLYAEQIEPYLASVGRENVHFVLFEELVSNASRVLTGVSRFLGVDSSYFSGFHASPTNVGRRAAEARLPREFWERTIGRISENVDRIEALMERSAGWDLERRRWTR